MNLFKALSLSLAQLRDPVFWRVLLKSALLTVAIFLGLGVALYVLIGWLTDMWVPPGMASDSQRASLAALFSIVGMIGAGWFLFRGVAIAVIGFFADEIVESVERDHYPQAAALAKSPGFRASLRQGMASIGRLLMANLLALPVYIVLLFTGIGTAILFFLLNGWLLGRDLDAMVMARHPAREAVTGMTRGERMVLGLAGVALLGIPVLNIMAPLLLAAAAVHLAQRDQASDRSFEG